MSKAHPGAIVFHTGDPDGDIKSQDTKALHTYGILFQTNWITIHDTDVQGNIPFSANALAKASSGTPFKRPENGQFRPGSHFQEFFFDETGDTNALTEAGAFLCPCSHPAESHFSGITNSALPQSMHIWTSGCGENGGWLIVRGAFR